MNKLRKTAGILLIIIGILGLFLPVIQGIILILLGASLINDDFYKKIKEFFSGKKIEKKFCLIFLYFLI